MKKQQQQQKKKKKKRPPRAVGLAVLRPHVAGVDIGSREHCVACPPAPDGSANLRAFGTTTAELYELVAFLKAEGVESVAMESTSVYWIPLFELLESSGIEAVLVDARQLHNVPGRKTDMQDCQWIQLLHSCGLLRASFRPSADVAKLRVLRRQMSNLVDERGKTVQWMQKALDQMNIRVHHAVTDVTGLTGMKIIRAIVDGERDPLALGALRDRRCKKSAAEIAAHLTGTWKDEHLFNLSEALALYDMLSTQLERYEARLTKELEAIIPPGRDPPPPHPKTSKDREMTKKGEQKRRSQFFRLSNVDLTRIDGISSGVAETVFTEVGFDLSAFRSEKSFISWLSFAPSTGYSAGKPIRKRKRRGMGAHRIAQALRQAATSVQRTKSALGAYFRRIARRKGAAVAIFATARKLACLVYRALKFGNEYTDIGADAYDAAHHKRRVLALQASARELGLDLRLAPASPA